MLGTIVNAAAIVIGGTLGLLVKKQMPERIQSIFFQAIGLFTFSIGITMVWDMEHILLVVASLVIGSLIGELLNIESGVERLSEYLKKKFKIGSERFSEGLITSVLLFCVGAMGIM